MFQGYLKGMANKWLEQTKAKSNKKSKFNQSKTELKFNNADLCSDWFER